MNAQLDPIYPVSLVPPDISSYRIGNTGVDTYISLIPVSMDLML